MKLRRILKFARELKQSGKYSRENLLKRLIEDFIKRKRIKDKALIGDLFDLLSKNPIKRANATFLVGSMGGTKTRELLRIMLKDKSPEVRYEAVTCISRIKYKAAAPDVASLLLDPDKRVRIAALETICFFNYRKAGEKLIKLANHPDDETRHLAIGLLGWFKVRNAVPLLKKLTLNSKDPKTRAYAVNALGYIKEKDSREVILKALEDKNELVRMYAAYAIANFSNALSILEKRLYSETSRKVRDQIVIALGGTGRKKAIPVLLNALSKRLASRDAIGEAFSTLASKINKDIVIFAASSEEPIRKGLIEIAVALGLVKQEDVKRVSKFKTAALVKLLRKRFNK